MLAQVIQSIKDISGFRFYFITTILFLMFLTVTFKDEIKQFKFNPKELAEVRNEQALVEQLELVRSQHKLINGYIFFVYQPKKDSYYKKLVATNIAFVKTNDYFKAMPLNAQKYLNYMLIDKEYVLLDHNNELHKEYIQMYASDYVYVYNVHVKETIAEVVFTFDVAPTKEELQLITKSLRTVKYYLI